ncbi:ECF RNA polymerase sigma factor SigE [Phycisphaerae bacterium RAS1]|nr:ECF RNA polymerase sigma factor SigE [Phycisphaerae bacterium RAS1]
MKIAPNSLNTPADPSVENEAALIRSAAAGDGAARRELFVRHRDAAFRVALRISGSQQDALDVVQDAYIKAFESLDRFEGQSGFKTWLLRIVSNKALDLLRSRKVRLAVSIDGGGDDDAPRIDPADAATLPSASDDGGVSHSLEQRELAGRLQAAIDKLPPDQRNVFAMYATGEMTYGEIAEAVGIPIGTVMSRLYHARRRLHELLADLAPRAGGKRRAT